MVTIRLHNAKTRRKEVFEPLDAGKVRMYVCGPTVYDRAHLGNARPVVVFDTLYRLLRHVYGADHVTYVRNFTDVDDKINATAQARKAADKAQEDRSSEADADTKRHAEADGRRFLTAVVSRIAQKRLIFSQREVIKSVAAHACNSSGLCGQA